MASALSGNPGEPGAIVLSEDDETVTVERHLLSPNEDSYFGEHASCIRQLYLVQSHLLGFWVLFAGLFFMHWAQALSLQQPWYRVLPNVWQENLLLQMLSSIFSCIEIQVWNLTGQRLKCTVPVRKVNPLLFSFLLPLPLSSQLAVSHCSYQIRSQCVLNGTLGHFFCVAALRINRTWSYHHGSCQRTGESGVYPECCRGALSCSISFVSNGKPEEHQGKDGTSGLDSQLLSSFCWQLISHSGTWAHWGIRLSTF